MLTPDYLEHAPDALTALMEQLEDDILRDVARRLGKMGQMTEGADWQLWRLSQIRGLRSDVVKRLAKYSGKTEAEIRAILQDAGTQTLAFDDSIYREVGLSPGPVNDSPALLNLLNAGFRQTNGTWQNLTATTADTVTREFENALDRAWLQVSSGAFDYNTAIRRAVNDLSRNMAYITYPTGHRDTLEVAVRRAVLTGVNQTAGKLQVARMDEMGCGFVEVTAHSGARPEHAAWQGKVYHRGGVVTYKGQRYPDFEAATGYGTGPGLCGWNCRHNFYPFFPGVSQRAYTEAELQKLNAREFEYQGKLYTKYELSQIQRGLERKVRKAKRDYLAEDSAELDTTGSALRYRQSQEALKQFCRDTGFPLDSSRTSTAGFGHRQAGKATWTVRQAATLGKTPDSKAGGVGDGKATAEIAVEWDNGIGTRTWTSVARKRMLSAEWSSTYRRTESGILYSADGKRIFRQEGDASEVRFTSAQVRQMRGGVLTHNHPGPDYGCFSPADINLLRHGRLSEVRVVTPNGVFSIQQPKKWPSDIKTLDKISEAYYDIDSEISPKYYDRARRGEISFLEAENLGQQAVVKELCRRYGIPFQYESWDDLREGSKR